MDKRINEKEMILYSKIIGFMIEDAQTHVEFCLRLANENNWELPFSLRVIGEYKRFLFLSAVCTHPVSPSWVVDQAWHLHLLYTKHYWEVLCSQILGKPFHHFPAGKDAKEKDLFLSYYKLTLQSYRRNFGEPPSDIWPTLQNQGRKNKAYKYIETKMYWLIPKPSVITNMIKERFSRLYIMLTFYLPWVIRLQRKFNTFLQQKFKSQI